MTPLPEPATSLRDVLLLLAITVPVGLFAHFIYAQSMFRAAQASDHFTRAAYRRFFWSVPALFLSWAPLLVGTLGNTGCALWRDAGHLIFPWPMLGVAALFGLSLYVCELLRQRLVRKHFPVSPAR